MPTYLSAIDQPRLRTWGTSRTRKNAESISTRSGKRFCRSKKLKGFLRTEEALLVFGQNYFFAATGVTGATLFLATVFLAALCFFLLWATFLTPVVLEAVVVLAAGFAAGFGLVLV